ncbi:probable polyamine oxidase 5 [Humulus lupulus]|uniref:probable polyamine oxidase 5 n=1 Tax=Humulus lupulus TaxID=3486 RepID=UPI002B401538|nr:probable polyamine oxidase 5 [Humulus lupulus]
MVAKKPRIVIIGAGMAGLTAANKLYTTVGFKDSFELTVVEGGSRIGGRINTSEFGGDRIEMGATWIHGIGGSPVHKIAQEIRALESEKPWECMDSSSEDPTRFTTVAEGGFELDGTAVVDSVSTLFKKLMDYAQGKLVEEDDSTSDSSYYCQIADKAFKTCMEANGGVGSVSVGSYLRQGLKLYWASKGQEDGGYGNWTRKLLEDGVFRVFENIQRTYTSADDLLTLDYAAESEYRMCSGEEITIAKGYLTIIESLASVLPPGLVQLGRKVRQIEWQPETAREKSDMANGYGTSSTPVKLHFCDGTTMVADHVIVTVSLGVLKAGVQGDSGMFNPPLPCFKTQAISRLGFGVVNKLFLQLSQNHDRKCQDFQKFPFLQMVFRRGDSELREEKVPWWMRKTASMFPIYENSNVLLSWFAGKEALELESLKDEQIISGVSSTISSFLPKPFHKKGNPTSPELLSSGNVSSLDKFGVKVTKVLKTRWGIDPLFMGSYSYVAVGSSGDDLDRMAEPLPCISSQESTDSPPLQLLFAGEATHRTHYSTTHGAYFSGLREANRILQHYHCAGV